MAPTSHLKYPMNTVMNGAPLTDEEVRDAFYSLKTNKSPGHDSISFNAINDVFDFIVESLRYIFSNCFGPRNFSGRNENCTNNGHTQRRR